jgi:hypothetical protein
LHEWVDDRIEDWYNAQKAAQSGEVQRFEYQGIAWFKPGKWVQMHKPFYWPEQHEHHPSGNDQEAVETMLKIMEIVKASIASQTDITTGVRHLGFAVMSFMWAIEMRK